MKIIVSHIGKQHVNALLVALDKRGVLTQFYTSIAANKVWLPKSLAFKKGNDLLAKIRKQRYTDLDDHKITHFPAIAAIKKVVKSEYWSLKTCHKWFDKKMARILKHADFDMVIGYETANLETFKSAKERGKITILDMTAVHHNFQNPILTQAGVYTNPKELAFVSDLKDQALVYTDYIIALSTFAEKTLVENGFPAHRIYKTYLGINQKVFFPKEKYNQGTGDRQQATVSSDQSIVNSQQSINSQSLTANSSLSPVACHLSPDTSVLELYFVGTLMLRKGMPFLMQVLGTLINKGLKVRLTLIGPVDDFPVPNLDVSYFRYIPFLNHAELVEMHHSLDLFVFPSNIDSWAQVVIEAMACGSPILVSENTGAKDAVAQGGGMVLPVGDLDAWVNAVEKFYYNRLLLKEIGQQAALVAQQYTWAAYHQQVFDVVTDIFNRENNIKTHYVESEEHV